MESIYHFWFLLPPRHHAGLFKIINTCMYSVTCGWTQMEIISNATVMRSNEEQTIYSSTWSSLCTRYKDHKAVLLWINAKEVDNKSDTQKHATFVKCDLQDCHIKMWIVKKQKELKTDFSHFWGAHWQVRKQWEGMTWVFWHFTKVWAGGRRRVTDYSIFLEA